MTHPTLTIIIPVYNTKEFLPRCIESVLNQNFVDFELLLIDDGSTDGSGLICDSYAAKDRRISVFHKMNEGVSSARNFGLRYAQGEWVTFIDSDDYVNDGYCSLPYDYDSVDLYAQNWCYATGNRKEFYYSQIIGPEQYALFLRDNLHKDFFRTACGFFFKNPIIRGHHILFENRFRLGEDTLFVLEYFRYATSIQIVDSSCYIYNRQDDWGKKYVLSLDEAIEYLASFWKCYDALQIEAPQLISFLFPFIKKRIAPAGAAQNIKWALSKPVLRLKQDSLSQKPFGRIKYFTLKAMALFLND